MAALVTAVHVATQRGSAAHLDGAHHPPLLDGHGGTVCLPIGLPVFTEDIGHFQTRPAHGNAEGLHFGQGV